MWQLMGILFTKTRLGKNKKRLIERGDSLLIFL